MPANTDTEEIRQAYIRMYDGMISKNERILDEVLDDSFVLVHMTGMRQPKQAFIKAVLNGTLNYFSAEHENIPVLGFIEHYDWNGKRVIPVNTSEGSSAGQSVQKIREVCRGAEVEVPYELIGSQVDSRIEEIRTWAKGKSEA